MSHQYWWIGQPKVTLEIRGTGYIVCVKVDSIVTRWVPQTNK